MPEPEPTPMMRARRAALSGLPEFDSTHFNPVAPTIDCSRYQSVNAVAEDIADLLYRRLGHESDSAGFVLAQDITTVPGFDIPENPHLAFFEVVWEIFAKRQADQLEPLQEYRLKYAFTDDGRSAANANFAPQWTFKNFHMDRKCVLFSHMYGPLTGFTEGNLVMADARSYLQRHRLDFDDVFAWSDEPMSFGRPVVRPEHAERLFTEFGFDLGTATEANILFVNNAPSAGIVHGVTPVRITDAGAYQRRIHRCNAKATGA
jgi:hypothetical protein